MNKDTVLAAFNEQIRRRSERSCASERSVVGHIGDDWAGVTFSDLAEATADAAIAAEVDRFAGAGRHWEWKHYSYDQPADLPRRLLAAGLTAEPAETLLVAEMSDLELNLRLPAGVELFPVVDAQGAAAVVAVHDQVFGGDHSAIGRLLLAGLADDCETVAGVVAMADGIPVAAGRVEFQPGTDFASIWGGGTVPAWRGQGVFRALVAYRAALAADRGFRYVQVDASAQSRPILQRLGFVELATTTPFMHTGGTL
ncbi:GNAT family N-acetyltransferase [Paeniglutamicibacter antarcticus]|uniref:GNAT family N-acetyltransferase n=1 Tax=Arthrobacter terrae TaxID=2935737 RepID=A0A931G3A0_9MICC|nr:GNAT family N-acetyltransferase [Arthrobacter terrae]MBG0738431.1 GNAT family N-acetyltransferase [Arthrobacter terrae]